MEIVSYCSTSGDERFGCAQAGCKDCLEALLYENSGLAWTMIARQLSGNAEYADLYQEALLGLWRAILYFDTSRGIRFSTFACIAVFRGVRQAVQRSWKAEGWLEALPWALFAAYLLPLRWKRPFLNSANKAKLTRKLPGI